MPRHLKVIMASVLVSLILGSGRCRAESSLKSQPVPSVPHTEADITYQAPNETVISPQLLRDTLELEDAPTNIDHDTRVFLDGKHQTPSSASPKTTK